MELSPLFSDDSRVAEAASIAQKLRKLHFIFFTWLMVLMLPYSCDSFISSVAYHSLHDQHCGG